MYAMARPYAGTMVAGDRRGLGQIVPPPRPSEVARFAVGKLLDPEELRKDSTRIGSIIGLLSFLEFLSNTRRKTSFVWRSLKPGLDEMARNPAAFDRTDILQLQKARETMGNISAGIQDFMTTPVDVPRWGSVGAFVVDMLSVGLVKDTWPTTFFFIHEELKKQLPKMGIRLVIERWKAAPPDKTSDQVFEVDEYSVPAGISEADVYIVSEGARTSLLQDAQEIEASSQEMEKALETAGVSLGAVQAAARAVPWLITKMASWIGTQGVKKASKVGLLGLLRGKVTMSGLARAVGWGTVIAATVTAAIVAIPRVPEIAGKLMDAASNAAGATGEAAKTLVIIAGIAAGVALVGGAIALVAR